MAAGGVFLTGFPGFLGTALVERLLSRYPARCPIVCLVQPAYYRLAQMRVARICHEHRILGERILLYEGDITRPDLGLGERYFLLTKQIAEIYHLAALYDLGLDRDRGMAVNVTGTRHVLQFAERCGLDLRRFHYVSTCFVSGRYPGVFRESDLDKGQSFNNCYEETKYLAEVEVQRRMRRGLPVTIYRPSIVVGDSKTGATQKYDGLYFFIRWLLGQSAFAMVPIFDDPTCFEFNFVPRDFVVDAIAHLSALDSSLGKVYQLCDPNPMRVDQVIELMGESTGRRVLRVRLPRSFAKGLVKHVPLVQKMVGIEPAVMDYFVHPTRYTCDNMLADLRASDICCPPFASYVENLVRFTQRHSDISTRAMA